jgi:hypothetical protein
VNDYLSSDKGTGVIQLLNMSNSKAFTVYIYEQEKRYLEWLVLQRQNIETGGDLFGLWQNENIVIVQLILGPGNGVFTYI